MKAFFIKVFLVVAATLCMFEGLLLVAVGLGRLAPDRLLAVYSRMILLPRALTTILGIGLFFVILGFIILALASRTRPPVEMIEVEKNGKVLRITQETIKDFIRQVLGQNPYVSDCGVDFVNKGEYVNIMVEVAFNNAPSVYQELDGIEKILTDEIGRVFSWKDFKFDFQVEGVAADSQKKYFSSGDTETQPAASEDPGKDSLDTEAEEEKKAEDGVEAEEEKAPPHPRYSKRSVVRPKEKSLLSRMLWGK